jgi:zinc protease
VRQYLAKSVALMTARQDQQVGYALDSGWHGIPELTRHMKEGLARLTRDEVNAAVRRHLSAERLVVVAVTKDARALVDALVADAVSAVRYEVEKPAALLEEDRAIGAERLGIAPEAVKVTPVAEVFAR